MMLRILIATSLAFVFVAMLFPAPASAQVDTWRVLHIGLQSSASTDTDGDGRVNTWYECTTRANGTERCKSLERSSLYRSWQRDMRCFKQTIEGWSEGQVRIRQDQIFIETDDHLDANPYDFAWSGYAAQYGFADYDVVMVWTGYTQALGFDGGAWGGDAGVGRYGFVALYGIAGHCDLSAWPAIVPPHEFTHVVTWLYRNNGWPVCGTYDYPEGHYPIWTNTHSPVTCTFGPTTGMTSTGIPAEAFASGSYRDYYG